MNKSYILKFIIFLVTSAFLVLSVSAQEDDWLPSPTGLYQVGTTTFHWIDEVRDETFTDDLNDKRELVVRVWYPADVDVDAIPIAYFPNGEADVRGFQTSHEADRILGETAVADFAHIPSHSYLDAPISQAQDSYPVLINTSPPFISTARNEELASHGYIVVSAYLTHIWGWTVFPDGREIAVNMFVDDWVRAFDAMTQIAVEDQIFILNQLELLNESDEQLNFSGRLQLDTVGILGSSWGAGVAMLTSLRDNRIQATVAVVSHGMAPRDVVIDGLDQPVMFMDAEGESSIQNVRNMQGPTYLLTLNGMTSFSVGDFGIWPRTPQSFQDYWLGDVDPIRAIHITNNYVLAFFNHYLKGEEQALLEGSHDDFPEVVMEFQTE